MGTKRNSTFIKVCCKKLICFSIFINSIFRHVDKELKNEMFIKFNSMEEEQVEELYGSRFDIHPNSDIDDIK